MYLIVDFEATCWDREERKNHPKEQEIIEVGAVLLDSGFKLVSEFKTFVRPEINPVLSPYCVELTGITQCMVTGRPTFAGMLVQLEMWLSNFYSPIEEIPFCSWGDYDRRLFKRACERCSFINPFVTFVNLKELFAKSMNVKKCGLRKACEIVKIGGYGLQHRALNHANCAADVFIRMMKIDPL